MDLDALKEILTRARGEVSRVIIGQEEVIEQCLIAIFTGSHALIEGVPGVAKTLLVRTLSRVLGSEFSRIQFTPDLMPTDITGTHIFDLATGRFSLVRGPVFTTFLLADEINRAPAKTQSALLEAMQERTVTIDRKTHPLNPGFTVFATQNPVEHEGTYPLPEAQKDRFMLKIVMDTPSRDEELLLAGRTLTDQAPEAVLAAGLVQTVLPEESLPPMRALLLKVGIKDEIVAYAVDISRKTRTHPALLAGAGPRATQMLILAARARAAMDGRDFAIPDDVKSMAHSVLAHRLVLRPEFEIEGLTATEVMDGVIRDVAVPR
ncbi:MAG: MoxR family ATPase [Proteobacteria bacterium]|nr:MoxR family ATPase [Pseudomonadota bacterium]